MRGEQAIFNLEIKKKSGLSINPDIHHSKVFSSAQVEYSIWRIFMLGIGAFQGPFFSLGLTPKVEPKIL